MIGLEEAAAVLKQADANGLVHLSLYRPKHSLYALCSCCPCYCHDLQLLVCGLEHPIDKIAVTQQAFTALESIKGLQIRSKYRLPLVPPADNMMQRFRSVDSRFSWHELIYSIRETKLKYIIAWAFPVIRTPLLFVLFYN